MKTILQHDECDCGAACLCMIAAHYGCKLTVSRCRELTRTDRTGTNLLGVVEGAEKIGLHAEGLSGGPQELLKSIREGEVRFPFVAHIISADEMLHFVVVTSYSHGKFALNDPAAGKRMLKQEQFFEQWTGNIAVFQKSEKFKSGNFSKHQFVKYVALLKGLQKKGIVILLLSFLAAGMGMAGAFVFQIVIDGIQQTADFFDSNRLNLIFTALIGLYLLQAVIQYIRGKLIAELSQSIDISISMMYYRHLINLPVSSVMLRQAGDYISRLSDAENIQMALSQASVTIFLDSAMAAACGALLFRQNSTLFAISCGMIGLYILVIALYQRPVEARSRKVMERKSAFQSYFKESVDGMELIKAAGIEERVLKKGGTRIFELSDAALKSTRLSISQELLSGNIELIGSVLILWRGFGMVLNGKFSLGTLMTFYALLTYFTEPIKNLAELQPTLQTAFVAADRLNDVLELKIESECKESDELTHIREIEFAHVNFRYGNRPLALDDVSLFFKKGERIAVVGESGSGKTSLAKLLLRFYEPESGDISINGKKISQWTLRSVRSTISYVSQEEFFFADSVRNNLILGNEAISDEMIADACRISDATDMIQKLPFGVKTPLDENGRNLSGGQKQKLAIARALLKKPQLLILDEATGHLDSVAEERIRENLMSDRRELSLVIITHRLSMAKDCDRILVMKDGKIVQEGTHEKLLKETGLYKELWNSQN